MLLIRNPKKKPNKPWTWKWTQYGNFKVGSNYKYIYISHSINTPPFTLCLNAPHQCLFLLQPFLPKSPLFSDWSAFTGLSQQPLDVSSSALPAFCVTEGGDCKSVTSQPCGSPDGSFKGTVSENEATDISTLWDLQVIHPWIYWLVRSHEPNMSPGLVDVSLSVMSPFNYIQYYSVQSDTAIHSVVTSAN